jgi:hypothetical protein
VVPTGTKPLVPSEICQLTKLRNAVSSSEPFLNGVTKAVKDPRKFVLAAILILQQTLRRRRLPQFLNVPGSYRVRDGGKRARLPVSSRYFAAVLMQT